MFDKKQLIKLFGTLIGGLALVGIMLGVLSNSDSGSIEFENNYSEVTYDSEGVDDTDDFDSDFDIDSDFDSDFGDDTDDFDVSVNYDTNVGAGYYGTVDFAEYKDAFDLNFDLLEFEKYIKKKYPEERYSIKDILIEKNENTNTGYKAQLRVDFEGYDTILRQEVALLYDLDESFNTWDYEGYELVGEEKIFSDIGDNEYSEEEKKKIPSSKTGTFVYEAINRTTDEGGQYRKLYVYFVAPGAVMDYDMSTACMTLYNRQIISFDYIKKTGDTTIHPKESVKYSSIENGLLHESENIPVFVYNEIGGMSQNKPYTRISDKVLAPEDIATKWVK